LTNAVTSITAGDGLSGGTITNTGTIAVDGSVVRTNDSRLTNSRAASTAAWSVITGTPTTLAGYGITDAVGTNDSRLTNARAASSADWSVLTSIPTTISLLATNDGSTLTNLNASSLASGTVATNYLSQNGAYLTNLNASNLASGTVATNRLPLIPLALISTNGAATGQVPMFTNSAISWQTPPAGGGSSGNYVHGQCRLVYTSSTTLTLLPFNGPGYLQINGSAQQIPGSGVTLANTGLTAATLYYVYAYMSGATMTLEAVTTGHATSSGIEIKSGDVTRTLVGMIYTGSGSPGTFVDSTSQRYVASFFNRRGREIVGAQESATTTSTSATVLNSGNNATCVTWGDEATSYSVSSYVSSSAANDAVNMQIGLDTSLSGQFGYTTFSGSGYWNTITLNYSAIFSEGFHTLATYGWVSAGTGSFDNILGQGIVRQ